MDGKKAFKIVLIFALVVWQLCLTNLRYAMSARKNSVPFKYRSSVFPMQSISRERARARCHEGRGRISSRLVPGTPKFSLPYPPRAFKPAALPELII